jgi:HlyD family secretion protein
MAAAIVALTALAIVGLSLWYLVQPQPLLVQGEADATRIDIAARIDGRVGQRPASRGDDVTAGQLLVAIDNPELLTKLSEAEAARVVAEADFTRIQIGTRAEGIAERKAAVASAQANLTLAQQTYERVKQVTKGGFEPVAKLDEATASLDVATRTLEQAKLAYQEAVAGYTAEERGVAQAAVAKAKAAIATLEAQVDEMTVKAPIAGQVYQVGAELGEYVSPGVPLLTLVDLSDVWLHFDLREDLVKGLKVGDRFTVKIPALGDMPVTVEVRTIATRGEYTGWRATRATGDFDLRTFEVRAYPVDKLPKLRPGMSAYVDWKGAH